MSDDASAAGEEQARAQAFAEDMLAARNKIARALHPISQHSENPRDVVCGLVHLAAEVAVGEMGLGPDDFKNLTRVIFSMAAMPNTEQAP